MSPSVEFTLMIALFILSATLLTLNLYSVRMHLRLIIFVYVPIS